MKINEVTKQKLEPPKPRNFVAKNATTSGATKTNPTIPEPSSDAMSLWLRDTS
jgi:hypothetical protein